MKSGITIICADVSINCLSRALTLAEILADNVCVQITGFCREGNIWPPARSSKIQIRALAYGWPHHWLRARQVLREFIDSSRIIICKPRLTSMGLALLAGCDPTRVVLDINDWELGLALQSNRIDGFIRRSDLMRNLWSLNSPLLCQYIESRIHQFPHRLVNNCWLQNRYGGQLIYDVRDTDRFDPEKFDKFRIRAELGLDNRPWVIFAGTARIHKGVSDLISALGKTGGPRAPGLLLCGDDYCHDAINQLATIARAKLGNARFRHIEQYDRLNIPYYLAAADLACIPSKLTTASVGQVPTKLFEAMAMGLPIIATQVCDMPDLVRDIGKSVPPDDPAALAEAIESLVAQPDLCRELGVQARAIAVNEFSYHAARPVLLKLMNSITV